MQYAMLYVCVSNIRSMKRKRTERQKHPKGEQAPKALADQDGWWGGAGGVGGRCLPLEVGHDGVHCCCLGGG